METEPEIIIGFELKLINEFKKKEVPIIGTDGQPRTVIQGFPYYIKGIAKVVTIITISDTPNGTPLGRGYIESKGISPTFQVLRTQDSYGGGVNFQGQLTPLFQMISFRVTKYGDKYKKEEAYESFIDVASL